MYVLYLMYICAHNFMLRIFDCYVSKRVVDTPIDVQAQCASLPIQYFGGGGPNGLFDKHLFSARRLIHQLGQYFVPVGYHSLEPNTFVLLVVLFVILILVLLMAEILHQFIGSLSRYLQGFIHPRWCKISAINSMTATKPWYCTWGDPNSYPSRLRAGHTLRLCTVASHWNSDRDLALCHLLLFRMRIG